MPHALIVDDDLSFQLAFAEVVQREGFTIATAPSLREAREELAKNPPHILFLDLNLPDGSGIDLLEDLEGHPETVLITGQASVQTAVEALRRGVSDYLTKPVDFARVKMVLGNVARTRELKEEIGSLRGELRKLGRFGPLIGASPLMQKVYDLVGRVARTDATVLITGETGTGKEMVAQTIHLLSRRSRAAFLPLNCGGVSPTLIESELFGHERGSFTGADRVHKGFYERADGGTLFLDEVTETPVELQVKLLRVLETGAVTRVGGTEAINVDVRVVAATNRQPEEAVAAGKLREDLLYRLNVFPIHLPTLWDRREDIDLLAEHFLGLLNKQEGTSKEFTRAALERLRTHRWPGNVRELRNVVQRAFILAEQDVGLDALPLGVHEPAEGSSLQMRVGTSVAEMERRLILATLEHFDGNKKKAAEILKIGLKTLYNRINQYKGGVP
ncbi:MAG: sigma-54-dependent Fis family transcriptional regulator [Acidobacteria bacterium]|nr:MAG: sigma-54-dependent Fis family transcriptional regulator [Acidobacteriota bacterium]